MPPSLARRPTLLALAACLAVAALSFLVEPFALLPDPWAWVVWGRELVGFDLNTVSGPSWKPLPPLVSRSSRRWAARRRCCGSSSRAGALLALVMAWRVARLLAGTAAGWIAAVAVGLALLPRAGSTSRRWAARRASCAR